MGTERVGRNRNVKVAISDGSVVLGVHKSPLVKIPLASIVGLTYDVVPNRPLTDLEAPHEGTLEQIDEVLTAMDTAQDIILVTGEAAPMVRLLVQNPLATFIVFPEFLFTLGLNFGETIRMLSEENDRFVYVVWRDQETTKDVLLRIDNEKQARGLLAALGAAAQRDPIDLDAQRRFFIEELEAMPHWSITLSNPEGRIRVGGRNLRAGLYTMSVLDAEDGGGQVFLFSGSRPRLEDLSTRVEVVIEREGGGENPQVSYRSGESGAYIGIDAITMEDRTLRFPAESPLGEPTVITYGGKPGLRLQAGHLSYGPVTLATYAGEPAVRFPMARLSFRESSGFLYVTPEHIVHDPVDNPGRKVVVITRGDVSGMTCRSWGLSLLKIDYNEGDLGLSPAPERFEDLFGAFSNSEEVRAMARRFCALVVDAFEDFEGTWKRIEHAAD